MEINKLFIIFFIVLNINYVMGTDKEMTNKQGKYTVEVGVNFSSTSPSHFKVIRPSIKFSYFKSNKLAYQFNVGGGGLEGKARFKYTDNENNIGVIGYEGYLSGGIDYYLFENLWVGASAGNTMLFMEDEDSRVYRKHDKNKYINIINPYISGNVGFRLGRFSFEYVHKLMYSSLTYNIKEETAESKANLNNTDEKIYYPPYKHKLGLINYANLAIRYTW